MNLLHPADISPSVAYLTIFGLLFLGAFGPSLPEEIILLIAGYFIARQGMDPFVMGLVAVAGILVSDNLIYGMGYAFGNTLLRNRLVRRIFSPRRQRWVRRLFFRWRFRLFFIGRYLYGLRPAILLFAGLTRVRWLTFFIWNGLAAFLNTLLWIILGYVLAAHIEAVMSAVRRGEHYILFSVIVLGVYFLAEWVLLRRGVLTSDSFLARVGAPAKIASLITLCVLFILLARMVHR
jgi:membrane protein DedA with SNARE-associated domain